MADRYGNYGNQDVEPWRRIPTNSEPKMEAEPPLWKKITTSIMSDPMPAPMPEGLVMKGPNAAINAAKVATAAKESLPSGATPGVESAIAYMKAKYPKLTGLVGNRIMAIDDLGATLGESKSLPGKTYGVYGDQPGGMSIGIDKGQSELHGVESTGHELTHAIQDARSQRVPVNSIAPGHLRPTLSGPGMGRSWPHGPFRGSANTPSMYQTADEAVGYSRNPYEVQANKGGQTATDTYDRFRRKLKPVKVGRPNDDLSDFF